MFSPKESWTLTWRQGNKFCFPGEPESRAAAHPHPEEPIKVTGFGIITGQMSEAGNRPNRDIQK